MRATRVCLWLVIVGMVGVVATAQDRDPYDDEDAPRRQTELPSAGFWPTELMMQRAIDRITDEMASHYQFDEDQLWNTREVIKTRFPEWLQDNRAEIQTLMNQYFEALLDEEPPTPEDVAEWAQRAAPLFGEFNDLIENSADDMRTYLTDEQQVLLEGELAAYRVGMKYVNERMAVWSEGGFDPETEFPRSRKARRQMRERDQKLHNEAESAKRAAMGLETVGREFEPGDEQGNDDTERQPSVQPAGPKDEWLRYVESFIKRYGLNEAQENSAHKYLRSLQELRDRYLRRKLPAIESLEKELRAAKTDEEKSKVQAAYERLNAPLDRYFQQLKDKLDKLPTRKQRAEAAHQQVTERTASGEPAKE